MYFMARQIDFPTELETAEWQMKYADVYYSLLKEKAVQTGMMNDKNMLNKIENAEKDAALKRQRYESLTAYSKERAK